MDEIINKVLSKTIHVTLNNERYQIKKFVSPELQQVALGYRNKFIRQNRFCGFLSQNQAQLHLIANGVIPFNFKSQLVSFESDIERLKVSLYKSRYNEKEVKEIRGAINTMRAKHATMYLYSESLNNITLEGMANDFMYEFIISKSLNKKVKYLTLLKIMRMYETALPNGGEIRNMCKSNKWHGLWAAKGTDLFDRELDDTQTYAISLSRLYDSVYGCEAKPEDFVIQDDDMLDGWLIFKRKESEQEKRRNEIDKNIPENAQEVFITAKSKEDVKRINDMNTQDSLAIKHYRAEMLKSKKLLKETELYNEK